MSTIFQCFTMLVRVAVVVAWRKLFMSEYAWLWFIFARTNKFVLIQLTDNKAERERNNLILLTADRITAHRTSVRRIIYQKISCFVLYLRPSVRPVLIFWSSCIFISDFPLPPRHPFVFITSTMNLFYNKIDNIW